MKKTGKLLQEKRESAGLSLSEVALATKINPKVLTAIESGDEAHLPAKTFLKGFVRSYALFLKMDVEEVLASFQEETGGPTPSLNTPLAKDAPVASGNSPSARRRMNDENSNGMRTAAVVVIVLLIGLIIGVRELIEKYQREKVTVASDPAVSTPAAPAEPTGPALTNTPAPAPAAATTPAAPATPPPAAAVPAPEPAKTPEPVPDKKAEAKSEPKPAPEPVKKEEPKKEEAKKEEPEPEKKLSKAVRNEIILEALDKVDVKMQIKGETKRISLGPTQVHTVRSSDPVSFDFSDGGAVSIIVNGRERGPAGELGKPKQITIP